MPYTPHTAYTARHTYSTELHYGTAQSQALGLGISKCQSALTTPPENGGTLEDSPKSHAAHDPPTLPPRAVRRALLNLATILRTIPGPGAL